jgi:hypothetical protein
VSQVKSIQHSIKSSISVTRHQPEGSHRGISRTGGRNGSTCAGRSTSGDDRNRRDLTVGGRCGEGPESTHCGRSSEARRGVAAVSPRMLAAGRASLPSLSKMQSEVITTFTSSERDYIRRQLDRFFSTLPTVADGFLARRSGGGQAETSANCQGAGGARPYAARYGRTPATAVLHRDGPSDATRDDGGPPFRRPRKIRPCSPGARHRSRLSSAGASPKRCWPRSAAFTTNLTRVFSAAMAKRSA